jgi:hypothetical protein
MKMKMGMRNGGGERKTMGRAWQKIMDAWAVSSSGSGFPGMDLHRASFYTGFNCWGTPL